MMFDLPPKQLWLPPKPAIIRAAKLPDKPTLGFLPGFMPPGAAGAGGAPAASIVWTAVNGSTSSPNNTLNFGSTAIGAADPSRQMLVLVRGNNANATSDTNFTTSLSVAGVSATRIVQPAGATSQHFTAWMTTRQDNSGPTGTSGTVSVTRSTGNGFNYCGIQVFALYNLFDPSLAAFTSNDTGNQTTVATATLNTPHNGVIAAMAFNAGGVVSSYTWSGTAGAVEVNEAATGISGQQIIGAAAIGGLAAASNRTVICTQADAGIIHIFALTLR